MLIVRGLLRAFGNVFGHDVVFLVFFPDHRHGGRVCHVFLVSGHFVREEINVA